MLDFVGLSEKDSAALHPH